MRKNAVVKIFLFNHNHVMYNAHDVIYKLLIIALN